MHTCIFPHSRALSVYVMRHFYEFIFTYFGDKLKVLVLPSFMLLMKRLGGILIILNTIICYCFSIYEVI